MSELFVIETSQRQNKGRGRPKGGMVWVPLPDAHTSVEDALRAMRITGTTGRRVTVYRRAGMVSAIRCEECELLAYGDLPEGWSQSGKSRFIDAPTQSAKRSTED